MTEPDERTDKARREDEGTAGVWDLLAADPAIGVCVVDDEGRILFINERAARLFLDKPAGEVRGKTLHELFPRPWAEERMRILERIKADGTPVILRHILRGRQLQSMMRRLEAPEGKRPRFLVLTLVGEHDEVEQQDGYEVVESDVASLGPLDVLSRRELEVLALLKHGMTIREIAETLHRSPKTIQSHRDAIARKLNETNRVRLAEIARQAGLELRDAGLKRV